MTSLQTSETATLGIAGEEDPMELSMDFERRFLGEEDIDIDLGLGGKSPYNQEDDFMLEDNSFMEDHSTYDGRQDGNDDEMVDEVGTPQPIAGVQDVYTESGLDDATGFDILVDDEDLVDVDDTMSQSGSVANYTEQAVDSHNVSSDPLPEDSGGRYFASNDFSLFQPLGDDHGVFQPVHEALLTTNNLDTEEENLLYHTQDTNSSVNLYSSSKPRADAYKHSTASEQNIFADLPQGSRIEFLSSLDHGDESSSAAEAIIEKDSSSRKEDDEKNSCTTNGRQLATSNPDEIPKAEDPSTKTPEHQGLNGSDNFGNMSHDVPEARNVVRHSPNTELATDVSVIATSDLGGGEEHDDLAYDTKDQDPTNLHPIIVVYQDNEISLFPPHEENEKHSATYFLQDESIANASIRVLLGACRVVLADSISEQDELEIKILPLSIDICETCSEASTFSLLQIMNLYLQLQHNDGIHYPDPLHIILTTRLSLPYRLQYLHNAVEEGLGFLDIVLPGSAEAVEARAENDDEQSQETVETTNEEPEKLVGQGSTMTDVHDEGDKIAGSPECLLDHQETGQNTETNTWDESPTMTQDNSDNHDQNQHSTAGNSYLEERPMSVSIESKSVKQTEQQSDDVSATALTDTSLSSHAAGAQISGGISGETLHSVDIDYDGQEEPHVSSAASSTLRGDTSDVAAGEVEADGLVITSQDERLSREDSYEEDDLDNFDTIVTNDPNGTSHLKSGSMNDGSTTNRRSNSPTRLVSQRKTSTSISDIDNNDITYEDEDEDQTNHTNDYDGNYGEADDNGDILTTTSNSVQDNQGLSSPPLSQHDSLKRAREVEDDHLSPEDDLQADMKRVRSI